MFNTDILNYLASPVKEKVLEFKSEEKFDKNLNGYLYNDKECFPIITDIPLLLPPNQKPKYNIEFLEVLFQKRTNNIFSKIDQQAIEKYRKTGEREDLVEKYNEVIKNKLGKKGVKNAIIKYSKMDLEDRLSWFNKVSNEEELINHVIKNIKRTAKYTEKEHGEDKLNHFNKALNTWAIHLKDYGEKVLNNNPKTIVELGTGAGLGTTAVINSGIKKAKFITLDIRYGCVRNAVGIAKRFDKQKNIFPIVANFWYLPFRKESISTICSHYGLDESREVPRVIEEISRVLHRGGKFINVSRSNPNSRPITYLKKLDFKEEEVNYLVEKSNLYPGPIKLIKMADKNNLILKSKKSVRPETSHDRIILEFMKK